VAKSEHAISLAQSGKASSSVARRWHKPAPDTVAMHEEPASADHELALIEAAHADARAFAPLYEAYVDLVWRYALSRLGDPHRAADATSATFQRAISALPNFQPQRRGDTTTFRSWLMTIARNVVIDEATRHRPATPLDDPSAQRWLVDHRRGPEEHAVAADERRRVERALAQLPDIPRQIVELRNIGMKGAEIAEMLNMSESAVKTAHFRAYARLRDLLAEPEDQGRPR
jgi:RNA polymerase sigma-70 factor (ECF subfamily)